MPQNKKSTPVYKVSSDKIFEQSTQYSNKRSPLKVEDRVESVQGWNGNPDYNTAQSNSYSPTFQPKYEHKSASKPPLSSRSNHLNESSNASEPRHRRNGSNSKFGKAL